MNFVQNIDNNGKFMNDSSVSNSSVGYSLLVFN